LLSPLAINPVHFTPIAGRDWLRHYAWYGFSTPEMINGQAGYPCLAVKRLLLLRLNIQANIAIAGEFEE